MYNIYIISIIKKQTTKHKALFTECLVIKFNSKIIGTYLPTYLLTYLLTYLPTNLPTYPIYPHLATYLPACLLYKVKDAL